MADDTGPDRGSYAPDDDPLLEVALEAARLLSVAMQTMRGEPEPAFASKVSHAIRRIHEIDAARTHGG